MRSAGGLLLTGGASRRLGAPKAELLRDGERLADRAARVLTLACDPVVEVGPGLTRLPSVREDPPGQGPLAAFAAGTAELAKTGHGEPVIVLAVDLPFVEAPLLEWLVAQPGAATVVPRVDGVPQTLCARYGATAGAVAATLLDEGERSMRALLAALEGRDDIGVRYVEDDEWIDAASERAFLDVDTAADVTRAGLERPG